MEAFSLLKYWRGGGGGVAAVGSSGTHVRTTIATAVRQQAVETDEDDDDEGPFFDMEFTVPDEEDAEGGDEHNTNHDDDSNGGDDDDEEEDNVSVGTDGEREFNFTVSSGSNGGNTDPNLSLSPSDELFFKGRLVPLESSSLVFSPSEPNSKPQFPVSLLKSATKFRVFTLGFKKPKSTTVEKTETIATATATATASPKQHQQEKQTQTQPQAQQQSKFFTVKLKVEEVPIVSLFTRDTSSRSSGNKLQKQNTDEAASDDKRFSKDVVQKYLKMIKPLYVKVSRRYGEKLRFSGQLSLGSGKTVSATTTAVPESSPTKITTTTTKKEGETEETEAPATNVKSQKQGSLPAGLREVCKHLGKSRSASSAVAAVPPVPIQAKRRDDSLLQQQDGIQSAILHCKRSFNAPRDSETSLLSRCTSDPSNEKSIDSSRNASDEEKDVCKLERKKAGNR
ncbi:hypothetical protein HHK36_027629 [Tetracentron sinense]|uniref:Membrane-associated kinase regulator 2 n=1 Tax=Tetracentron sinense TaxID=13715 RepID=A0A834YI52_TETSI|nr:hypothetical protein HHK36_027629 [Tetracentron sinense]